MVGAERYGTRQPNPREKRVIELVAQGLKNKEVADEIGTTEHVVKNYLRVIYDKLGTLEPRRTRTLVRSAPIRASSQLLRVWRRGNTAS